MRSRQRFYPVANDHLARVLGNDRKDLRFEWWLWHRVFAGGEHAIQRCEFGTSMARDLMADKIESHSQYLARSWVKEFELTSGPLGEFDWILDDERQCSFLRSFLKNIFSDLGILNSKCKGKNSIILMMDLYLGNNKCEIAAQLKFAWEQCKIKDKKFAWFDEGNSEQRREIFYEFMQKNHPEIMNATCPIDSHSKVLMFFDRAALSDDQENWYVEKIKKKASQKKYRENLHNKKQYNFIMSNNLVNYLSKMAEKHNLTRSKLLELLIGYEMKHNLYIKQWEKDTRAYITITENTFDESE